MQCSHGRCGVIGEGEGVGRFQTPSPCALISVMRVRALAAQKQSFGLKYPPLLLASHTLNDSLQRPVYYLLVDEMNWQTVGHPNDY